MGGDLIPTEIFFGGWPQIPHFSKISSPFLVNFIPSIDFLVWQGASIFWAFSKNFKEMSGFMQEPTKQTQRLEADIWIFSPKKIGNCHPRLRETGCLIFR